MSSDKFDYYADGSKVEDGEWYALVWSSYGHDFAGFNADFTAISDQDVIVLAAPLAKNGKCRDVVFQVPKKQYEDLKDGNWQLCLLDTRGASRKPLSGAIKPTRVARWTIVGKPKISASIDNMSKLQRRSSAYACKSSSMPKTFTSPKISSIATK